MQQHHLNLLDDQKGGRVQGWSYDVYIDPVRHLQCQDAMGMDCFDWTDANVPYRWPCCRHFLFKNGAEVKFGVTTGA